MIDLNLGKINVISKENNRNVLAHSPGATEYRYILPKKKPNLGNQPTKSLGKVPTTYRHQNHNPYFPKSTSSTNKYYAPSSPHQRQQRYVKPLFSPLLSLSITSPLLPPLKEPRPLLTKMSRLRRRNAPPRRMPRARLPAQNHRRLQ